MDQRMSIGNCFDESGKLDLAKFEEYKLHRDKLIEEEEVAVKVTARKRKFAHRNSSGYDPQNALDSLWYKLYVEETDKERSKKFFQLFRRRFRLLYQSYLDLVAEFRDNDWLPKYEKRNALGQLGIPLGILILGSLRYLGRGWTFDDITEATGVSEEVHRRFFKDFTIACTENLYPKWIKRPETAEEIEDCMSEFVEAGFNGCIGSADVTHVIIERCHARLKNQHLGPKGSHTTRAFQVVVNHRRQIIASTLGYPGRWNDQTIVRFDGFVTDMKRGLYLKNHKFTLKNNEGEDKNYKGAWILVDGGYLNWSTLICSFKATLSVKEQRWSRWAESMRKDVECTFGILKGKLLLLCYISLLL